MDDLELLREGVALESAVAADLAQVEAVIAATSHALEERMARLTSDMSTVLPAHMGRLLANAEPEHFAAALATCDEVLDHATRPLPQLPATETV